MSRPLLALYGVQFAGMLVPLVTLPWLARVLGPAVWGQLAAIQALAATLALVVEYGFVFSATRLIARSRHDAVSGEAPPRHVEIAAAVLGAKLLLSAVMLLAAGAVLLAVPAFREVPGLYAWGVVFALVQGFSPLWYFQGVEQLQRAAAVEVAGRVVAAAGVLVLVTRPSHAWVALALQATALGVATGLNVWRMYRTVPFRWPSWADAITGVRDGWSMFLFRGAVSLYTTANTAMLRVFVPSAQVAQYANADRLATAGKSLVQPVSQLMFPRISYLIHHDPAAARRTMLRSLGLLLALSCVAAGVGIAAAPWFVPWFFGAAYTPTVPLFQWLLAAFPAVAASNVLGVQWMLPNGMDRAFNAIIMATGLLNVCLVWLLVPRYGAQGMAWTVFGAECFVTLAMLGYLHVRRSTSRFRKADSKS
ncbi:oligosaccharide flippase family protein [Deinococcus yunweiensis]|uniref:oligosaccharide flippase family protein n=1 Tax=Deinococcus yunweiensis TaxID=367282 RepID=UPI00398E3A5C